MGRRFGLTGIELRQVREVALGNDVRHELQSHSFAASIEICAALYGHLDSSSLTVGECRWLVTEQAGPSCFTVSVDELLQPGLAAEKPVQPTGRLAAPESGQASRLVGLFHTHPLGSALPSDLDRRSIARLPFIWTIAGLEDGEPRLRAYAWTELGIRELTVSEEFSSNGDYPQSNPLPWGASA